jgi:DNA-binding NtrC family response regulator
MSKPITKKYKLLLVDDDALIGESLSFVLSSHFDVITATSRPMALDILDKSAASVFDIALVDLGLPPTPHTPTEGLGLISDILSHSSQTRIVVLSGQNEESNARLARTLGATDFVGKPVAPDALKRHLLSIAELKEQDPKGSALLGNSMPVTQLKLQLRQFADSQFPVLIEGESGTGKELAARALHQYSCRSEKPYLALNCAAIAPTLVEAALFGHGRGAFTGAHVNNAGYFEDALDGTLFLDEIGELPLELQPKLLRVLENGEFQRVGETHPRQSSARIVAATNRDLREEVKAGRFRADLYHRLSVFSIRMPPLRSLGEDKRALLESFFQEYAEQMRASAPTLSDDAWEQIRSYPFPGNVRELRNVAIRLTTKYAGREISAHELLSELDIESNPSRPWDVAESHATKPLTAADHATNARKTLLSNTDFRLDDEIRAMESAYIEAAQDIANGNISHAARLLGLSRTTLYNRMESLAKEQRKLSQAQLSPLENNPTSS